MRRITVKSAVPAAAMAAVLVVPMGTANAAPTTTITAANFTVAAASGAQSVLVTLRDGAFQRAGNALVVVDPRGRTVDRVPLTLVTRGATVPLHATVSEDRASAQIAPRVAPQRHSASAKKDSAWNAMMAQLNKDWPCASGYVGGGALIGFLLGLLTIVGWTIGIAVGAAAGAYVGYTTCNGGKGWRAVMNWWNTP